jgi:hypothetical protein
MDVSGADGAVDTRPGIGLLNETPLHASLKEWYARPGDQFEVPLDGYVIDIVRDGLLVEIQTSHLASIKSKLTQLARTHRIRLVYPIAREKWIVRLPVKSGGATKRRKSPKRGRLEDLFWEAVSFPQLLALPDLSLEILLTQQEEVWRYDGNRSWRRKGWAVEERRLLDVIESRSYEEPTDWRAFLPGDLERFTAKDLADALGIRLQLAQRMAYTLRHAEVIEQTAKRGRAHVYEVVDRA